MSKYQCKYSEYEWKNKTPARFIEQGEHIIWAVIKGKEQPFPLVGYRMIVFPFRKR